MDQSSTPRTANLPAASAPLLTADSALYLDFDGTLVELASTPDGVQLADGLLALLQRLQGQLGGALALVSGRRLDHIDALLAPLRFAGAGLHGAQLRATPEAGIDELTVPAVPMLVAALKARFHDDDRILVENKQAAVALHYRLAPERQQECETALRELAEQAGLAVVSGHCVIEARPRGIDKGYALRKLAESAPFAGRRPVFVGDDRTDEDGIAAAQSLGGLGIRVGDAKSVAQARLADVAAVHAWLIASCEALR